MATNRIQTALGAADSDPRDLAREILRREARESGAWRPLDAESLLAWCREALPSRDGDEPPSEAEFEFAAAVCRELEAAGAAEGERR